MENKKLSEEDYRKMVDQAWTMPRGHTGLRLMCHEGILEMTGNRGGECGFLRLEQMRLTDTSQLALHPGAFRVWEGDDSSIVRWSAWTKNQGANEICRSMARRAAPEYCGVAALANWLTYQLDIRTGPLSYRQMMEDLTTNRHGEWPHETATCTTSSPRIVWCTVWSLMTPVPVQRSSGSPGRR